MSVAAVTTFGKNVAASERSVRQAKVVSEMKRIHSERHKDTYGSPWMHQELVARGYEICETTVAKLMQREGLSSSSSVRFRACTTDSKHCLPVADNTVNREFDRDQINEVCVSDLTYIPTQSGWLCLAIPDDGNTSVRMPEPLNSSHGAGSVERTYRVLAHVD